MAGPYYHPAPAPRTLPTWLPAALLAAAAAIGLVGTLLPVWSVDLSAAELGGGFTGEYPELQGDVGGTARIGLGFYDWGLTAVPVLAVIPVTLAAMLAIAVALLARGTNAELRPRTLWGAAAAMAVCTILLAVFVVLRPSPSAEVTGELRREVSPRDLEPLTGGADFDVSYGSGLIIAVGCLVAALGIAAWQYVVSVRPPRVYQPAPPPIWQP